MPFPGQVGGAPGQSGGKLPSFTDSLKKIMQGIAEAKFAPDADQGLLQAMEQAILQAVQQRAAAPPPGMAGLLGGLAGPMGMGGPPGPAAGGGMPGLPGGAGGAGSPPGVAPLPNVDMDRLLAGTA